MLLRKPQMLSAHRPTAAHISLEAIYHNVHKEIETIDSDTKVFAVVKANAYGYGMLEVAHVCLKAGVQGFCVATLDEALILRNNGIAAPVLVLGIVDARWAALASSLDISLAVGDIEWLKMAEPYLEAEKLKIHLALDTGMGRIGFQSPAEFKNAENYIRLHTKKFDFSGVFTHFATADGLKQTYFDEQCKRWHQFMQVLTLHPKYIHVSNTATSLFHAECNGNMIRLGMGIYGLDPSDGELELPYTLEPALRLTTKLSFVKYLSAGKSISYGATYTAKKDEWIGTLPIGYADGYPRCLQGFHVLIDNQFCEIVGRICMDQFMVRLPHKYDVNTPVVLIGSDGDKKITVQAIAKYAKTAQCEVVTRLGPRVPRIYEESSEFL
ncbi:alanine racemase [Liquorilactobacillus aquaticus]